MNEWLTSSRNTHSIKKARPSRTENPVFAVKFIHKEYAAKHGKLAPKQLQMEVALHKHIGRHGNIIMFFETGEDPIWRWIAMELAEGGDLFDKIEADEGVGEGIAHAYFVQLVNAVRYMHEKGVGHRDIKPENILLSADGNLKVADFGLATLFEYHGMTKLSTSLCGSPPYIAPEVIYNSNRGQTRGRGYRADLVDIWSCGVVLFVLLVGNTPWDSPTEESYEFCEYVKSDQKPQDELWDRLPRETISLLRGILNPDVTRRFTMEKVLSHPWFKRKTKFLTPDARLANPVNVATSMFESLHVDFSKDPLAASQVVSSVDPDDANRKKTKITADNPDAEAEARPETSTPQPEPPAPDNAVNWDSPPRLSPTNIASPTQSNLAVSSQRILPSERLVDEPSMSQFGPTPSVPFSRTQNAQRFRDIVPSSSLTRFFSAWSRERLTTRICEALQMLRASISGRSPDTIGETTIIRIRVSDDRRCPMLGNIIVEGVADGLVEVEFLKAKGDPLEWRRFFKRVVVLCKDAVVKPEQDESQRTV